MVVQECLLPMNLPWWHRKKMVSRDTTRDELPPNFTAHQWEHPGGMFLWLSFEHCYEKCDPDFQVGKDGKVYHT